MIRVVGDDGLNLEWFYKKIIADFQASSNNLQEWLDIAKDMAFAPVFLVGLSQSEGVADNVWDNQEISKMKTSVEKSKDELRYERRLFLDYYCTAKYKNSHACKKYLEFKNNLADIGDVSKPQVGAKLTRAQNTKFTAKIEAAFKTKNYDGNLVGKLNNHFYEVLQEDKFFVNADEQQQFGLKLRNVNGVTGHVPMLVRYPTKILADNPEILADGVKKQGDLVMGFFGSKTGNKNNDFDTLDYCFEYSTNTNLDYPQQSPEKQDSKYVMAPIKDAWYLDHVLAYPSSKNSGKVKDKMQQFFNLILAKGKNNNPLTLIALGTSPGLLAHYIFQGMECAIWANADEPKWHGLGDNSHFTGIIANSEYVLQIKDGTVSGYKDKVVGGKTNLISKLKSWQKTQADNYFEIETKNADDVSDERQNEIRSETPLGNYCKMQ